MIKGTKFITQLYKALQKDRERRSDIQQQEKSKNISQSVMPIQQSRLQLKVKKKKKNFFNRIYLLTRNLEQNHIYKLCGFLGINQKALQNSDCSQSLLYTHFESRVIQRIQFYDHAILIEMAQPTIPFNQPPAEYIIEKYRSKGDANYYQLSCMIQQFSQLIKKAHQKPKIQQKTESIKKWLEFLGDQMLICNFDCRKFAISKSLLTYLEYDFNQFSIEAVKYRAIFSEMYSAINYGNLIKHILNCFKYMAKYSLQEVSQAEFKQMTTYTYDGFIQSKNHVRTYCNMTIQFINPTFLCHKQVEAKIKKKADPKIILAIEDEKDRIRQAQYATINKIKALPRRLMKQNEKLQASYKQAKQETQRKYKQIRDK